MPVCVCVGGRGKIERDREKQETSIRRWIPLCYPQHGQRNCISESETLCISSDAFHKMLFHRN